MTQAETIVKKMTALENIPTGAEWIQGNSKRNENHQVIITSGIVRAFVT